MSMCIVRCPTCKAYFVESSEEWNIDRECCKGCVPRNKYRNIKTEVDGILFDSQREALRYKELLLLERQGKICDLELQPVFRIVVNGKKIAKYIADFRYRDRCTSTTVIEDVKGMRTSVYQLKKKLVEALYNIQIIEV
jgi:hypothetical protein